MDSTLPLNIIRKREKKESQLDTLKEIVGTCYTQIELKKRMFEEAEDRYKKWKEANKVPGIKY